MPGLPVKDVPGEPCTHPLSSRNTWPGGVASGGHGHIDGASNGGVAQTNGKRINDYSADKLSTKKAKAVSCKMERVLVGN